MEKEKRLSGKSVKNNIAMKPILYRFSINGHSVRPTYKDDLSIDYELESAQQFFRAKLSGKLLFLREDFDWLNEQEFETEFILLMEQSLDGGKTWQEYYKGKFMKTDCTWDLDNKKCEVQPDVYDQYNDVIAGLEKEYNLIKLAPEIQKLIIRKRPLIQIYVPGDSVISCFLGGTYWEQDANVITNKDDLINKYHFALNAEYRVIELQSRDFPSNLSGTFVGKLSSNRYYNSNGDYMQFEIQDIDQTTGLNTLFLYDKNGNFIAKSKEKGGKDPAGKKYELVQVIEQVGGGTIIYYYDANGAERNIYARYLCDVDKIDDLSTYDIPTDDISQNNRNYKKAIGYAIDVTAYSTRLSYEPTEWGIANNGMYFMPPSSIFGDVFYPIARSTWSNSSLWFSFAVFDWILEEKARKTYTLNDSYPISSVISVLLKQFAPEIKHEATTEYSQFLYGDTNPISGLSFRLFVSQKTNILNGDYTTPAQKAPTTLKQFLDMLKNCFQCYWYIEDSKLKIEHISWFKNGGSYSSNPVISFDLTKLENVRNGKKWAFATSNYSFEKQDMAERYQFSWMDDVTEAFEGEPIEVISKYVSAGRIEDITISNFTSDIDMMLLNLSNMSSDGFALFAGVYQNGNYELPFIRQTVNGVEYYLQNGYMAFINLIPSYWKYNLPARRIKINGEQTYAYGIERNKKQTVNIPLGDKEINPIQLVKTNIGNGQINKLSVNLSSRMIKAELKYDTE